MAEAFSTRQTKQTDQASSRYNQTVENSIRNPPLGYIVNSHQIKWTYRFKEDIGKYNPLLDSLEQAFSEPLFCCGGSLKPPNMDKFVIKVMSTTPEAGEEDWEEYKLTNIPLDKLLDYCNPAPFGDLREMKTVLDPDVRLAYELESKRFKIEREHTYMSKSRMIDDIPASTWIKKRIEETLTPGRSIKLERYKLNVYSREGFFKSHVDSPSGDEMMGTLVLCLPSPHKGGELRVSHDGLEHTFDFSNHSGDTGKIQWAAFYGDCIHEVKPVLEGHRVTVTYNITLPTYEHHKRRHLQHYAPKDDPDSLDEHFEVSTENPSIITKALANVNTELEKIRQQGRGSPSQIGILLKHKYISKGLQPLLLKGEDKALFDFLMEKQWKCQLMSVVSRYQTRAIYPYGLGEDGELDESHEIYEFNPLAPSNPPNLSSGPRRMGRDFRQWRVGIPFIDIYRRAGNGAEHLVRNIEGQRCWIGNEVEDVGVDKIYLDSAVIVHLCKEPYLNPAGLCSKSFSLFKHKA